MTKYVYTQMRLKKLVASLLIVTDAIFFCLNVVEPATKRNNETFSLHQDHATDRWQSVDQSLGFAEIMNW